MKLYMQAWQAKSVLKISDPTAFCASIPFAPHVHTPPFRHLFQTVGAHPLSFLLLRSMRQKNRKCDIG